MEVINGNGDERSTERWSDNWHGRRHRVSDKQRMRQLIWEISACGVVRYCEVCIRHWEIQDNGLSNGVG